MSQSAPQVPGPVLDTEVKQTINKCVICQQVLGFNRAKEQRKGWEEARQKLPCYLEGHGLPFDEMLKQSSQGREAMSHVEKNIPGTGSSRYRGPEAGGQQGGQCGRI